MRFKTPAQLKTFEAFRERLRAVDPELGCDAELLGAAGPLGRPITVAGKVLNNRFAIHPMEGWDGTSTGLPSAHTLRRWRRFGRSGAKLIWGGEAFAVCGSGRANPNQLFSNAATDTAAALTSLRDAARSGHEEIGEDPDSLLLGLQLTHSGRFSRPTGELAPRIAYRHPVLDARFGVVDDRPVLSDDELQSIGGRYVDAAVKAHDAGFDFVDVKCCHGYLMHELLGARSREGRYGGSFENRTRLLSEILAAIQARCPGLEIGVRVSIGDVFPHSADPDTGVGEPAAWEQHVPFDHGFGMRRDDPREVDLTEPLRLLELLSATGIRLVNLTLGSPYYCPHVQRPAAYPPSDGYQPPEDPLIRVAQHLRIARECKQAFQDLVFVGTGYSYLQEWLPNVAQYQIDQGHIDFVGLGRMVLSYPELPRDVLAGRKLDHRRICRTLSDCTTAPRNGMISGCFPLDPYYKDLPEATELKHVKKLQQVTRGGSSSHGRG